LEANVRMPYGLYTSSPLGHTCARARGHHPNTLGSVDNDGKQDSASQDMKHGHYTGP